jgi:phage terminase large subunit-like protein
VRAGPKAEITAAPLELSTLRRSGAPRVDQFAREYLKATRGKGARGPFRCEVWQKQIVSQHSRRLGCVHARRCCRCRGNGKTSLAAVLGAYGLYADGVESAEVVVVASDARQAGITLRQIARMVELEPRLAEQTQVFQSRLYVPHTDSTLVVLPAEPGALQGWNPSLAIVDEFYVVNRQVWDAVSLAAGKLEIPVTRTLPGMLATPW